ncbi:MAG: ROK family protein [Anaerolineae bacterium]|nr:ROK family protein [Anaerolineae bacterium]
MSILAIDFGGTRVRAGWFTPTLEVLAREETLSRVDEPIDRVLQRIVDLAAGVVPAGATIEGIGISAPSPQSYTGYIRNAAVVPHWENVPLAQIVSDAFDGVTVYMENDGNLAALAEYHMGAAQGANPALYMTISTGIGGGVVIDGHLFTGRNGLAFEPGHIKYLGPDGKVHSLEDFASGRALGRIASEKLAASSEPSVLRDLPLVTGKDVGQAAREGDALALGIIEDAGWWLGLGLINVLQMYNPEVVVIGGSVSSLGELILKPARKVIQQYIIDPIYYHDDIIQPARLGDDVCLIGAASYARDAVYG